MPTIDQLTPAVVSADDDLVPVSQGGTTRAVTRSQLLAGMQPALSLGQGLLGRASATVGAPETIGIGGGLSFVNGRLVCPPAFAISALANSSTVNPTDLVAISQGGQQVAVSASTLVSMAGADASSHLVATPAGTPRRLIDWLGDSLAVEAFGAVGDGLTDDTAAFGRAIVSGRPVRLGAKTYRIDGQWTVGLACVLLGSPGQSVLRRGQQAGGAWISVAGPSFTAVGVTFDAGSVTTDSWGVVIGSTCSESSLADCTFKNAAGATLGCGLMIQARAAGSGNECHTVRNCVFANNAVHGLWVQAATHVLVEGCAAFSNGAYGICLDYNDPTFQLAVRESAVIGCRAWQNQRGISIGNFNQTNLEPPTWGLANPDATDIVVSANICENNSAYGIAVSGERIRVRGNQVTAGVATQSGILFNASSSTLEGNGLFGTGQFGIDAGGCADCEISDNSVDAFKVGINAGGGIGVRVVSNRLVGNERAITIFQVETDGKGGNFGLACRDLWIDRNFIDVAGGATVGIALLDGPQNVSVTNNDFYTHAAPAPAQALVMHSDTVFVSGNRLNGVSSVVCNSAQTASGAVLIVPDLIDRASVPSSLSQIGGLLGTYQANVVGQVTFIRVIAPGSGYSRATVVIGGAGSGASATAYIRDGQILGVAVQAGGSGYDPATVQATIVGDGTGATLLASVGLPIQNGRRLSLRCDAVTSFASTSFASWLGPSFTVPAGSEVVWSGINGVWEAVSFASVDYVSPDAAGGLSLRTRGGDLRLQPGGGGQVRLISPTETTGYVSCLGRGSPQGAVAAPPGSDYRNLDGGAGSTLWIKQVGFDSNGWIAVA